MELYKVINNKTFDEVSNILTKEPFFLKVKQCPVNKNLYMLLYDKNKSNFSYKEVNECRGIILEKETNKVICYTFNKKNKIEDNNFFKENWDDLEINEALDGTQIKMYFYNNIWNFSTTRMISAKRSFWYSNRSFEDLFLGF